MYDEDELLPISALQHLVFCELQWGLIHLEKIWEENRFTAEGRVLHSRSHEGGTESRGDVRVARALRIRSLRLGLTGVADVVEFHRLRDGPAGISLPGISGFWKPVPVEYKRGRPKSGNCDKVQLCAQALCLEEMLDLRVECGALYYGKQRRRTGVEFDEGLRAETETVALRLHEMTGRGITPPGRYSKKCDSCSLFERCMPRTAGEGKSAQRYLSRSIREIGGEVE